MSKTQNCSLCECEVSGDEIYILHGKILCDDCHMEETHPVKVCNPLPVRSAKNLGSTNKNPKDALTELQNALYVHVVENKKVTSQQLCIKFNLTPVKLTNQLAILRHLELIKGKKEENNTYIVPF